MTDNGRNVNVAYTRSREVLRLLSLYGPLHLYTMENLMSPAISRVKLRDVLLRLSRKGFISKRAEKMLHPETIYYEISRCEIALQSIAKFMKMSVESLRQPNFRRAELLHAQFCTIWAYKLKCLYPDALIVPDYKMTHDENAKELLQLDFREKDIYPDLLLVFPESDTSPSVGVAVEIERTRKSSKRLTKKIKKYTNLTLIDGVLYVCEKKSIPDVIRDIYKYHVMPMSYRIQHYEKNFFMFSHSISIDKIPDDKMLNGDSERVLFPDWIKYLREVCHHERENINI